MCQPSSLKEKHGAMNIERLEDSLPRDPLNARTNGCEDYRDSSVLAANSSNVLTIFLPNEMESFSYQDPKRWSHKETSILKARRTLHRVTKLVQFIPTSQ